MEETLKQNERQIGYIKALLDAARVIENAEPEEIKGNKFKLMNKILGLAHKFD